MLTNTTVQLWLSILDPPGEAAHHLEAATLTAQRAVVLARDLVTPGTLKAALEGLLVCEWARTLVSSQPLPVKVLQQLFVLYLVRTKFGTATDRTALPLFHLPAAMDRVLTVVTAPTVSLKRWERELAFAHECLRAATTSEGPLAYGLPLVDWTAAFLDELDRLAKLRNSGNSRKEKSSTSRRPPVIAYSATPTPQRQCDRGSDERDQVLIHVCSACWYHYPEPNDGIEWIVH